MTHLTEQFHISTEYHAACSRLMELGQRHLRRLLEEEYWQDRHLEAIQTLDRDAIKESNVELKPANESRGRGKLSLLVLIGGVIAVGYWLRKSQKPTETLQSAASETADQTKQVTKQATDTIKEGGETVTDRVEEGSKKASEQVEQTGETVAEEAEEASEMAAEKASGSGSSSGSS